MKNFFLNDLERKDFLASLGLWFAMEIISFLIFPGVRLITPGERLWTWFIISLPLGIGGAFLIGASSRFIAVANDRPSSRTRTLLIWLGQFGGWIGLAGVTFPLLMVCIEFLTEVVRKVNVAS